MYPSANRLAKKTDIDRTWKKGRSFATPLFSLKIAKSNRPMSRFAVVVGLKVSKRAVIRNLAKRRIREGLRALLPDMLSGHDVLVLGRPKLTTTSFGDISNTLRFAFDKSGLLKRKV